MGVIPVVNENDTVATDEIRYGDNDRLAARVAQMIGADLLILLSDVDGLYTADPRSHPEAVHIPLVETLTPEIEAMATGPDARAGMGTGGRGVGEDQVVHGAVVVERERALGVGGDLHAVAGLGQHLFQQDDVGFLVVDDQDPGIHNFASVNHHGLSCWCCSWRQIAGRRPGLP